MPAAHIEGHECGTRRMQPRDVFAYALLFRARIGDHAAWSRAGFVIVQPTLQPAGRCQAGGAALMRISLRDQYAQELGVASVADVHEAPAEAMFLLARFGCLYPGSLLIFDDDRPSREPGTPTTLTVGHLQSLAARLEQWASAIELAQPLSAEDLRTAARICRHALKVGRNAPAASAGTPTPRWPLRPWRRRPWASHRSPGAVRRSTRLKSD
jgi:hypothetical protein